MNLYVIRTVLYGLFLFIIFLFAILIYLLIKGNEK